MKTRFDFVSNSSSSSYIIAFDAYESNNIFNSLAQGCADEDSECHSKSLLTRNRLILDFCANTFQLLFIGSLRIETKKIDYTEETFNHNYCDAKKEFERYKKMVDESKNSHADRWMVATYGNDERIDDNHYVHYENIDVSEVVVSNDRMEHDFNRYHFDVKNIEPEDQHTIEERAQAIVEAAKFKHENENRMLIDKPDIYCITLDTIANTRNLIETGYKIIFDAKWQNLDLLEKKIKDGDKIMYVRVAYQGDGYGDFYIYDETDGRLMDNVNGVEVLGGESL